MEHSVFTNENILTIDPLHNAQRTYTHVSCHAGCQKDGTRVYEQCACKHVYHPFVHVLTPSMADRKRACMCTARCAMGL